MPNGKIIEFVYRPRGNNEIPDQTIKFASQRDAVYFAENIIETMAMIGIKSNRFDIKKKNGKKMTSYRG